MMPSFRSMRPSAGCGCERDPGVPKWAEGHPWQPAALWPSAAVGCPVATVQPVSAATGANFPTAAAYPASRGSRPGEQAGHRAQAEP